GSRSGGERDRQSGAPLLQRVCGDRDERDHHPALRSVRERWIRVLHVDAAEWGRLGGCRSAAVRGVRGARGGADRDRKYPGGLLRRGTSLSVGASSTRRCREGAPWSAPCPHHFAGFNTNVTFMLT